MCISWKGALTLTVPAAVVTVETASAFAFLAGGSDTSEGATVGAGAVTAGLGGAVTAL